MSTEGISRTRKSRRPLDGDGAHDYDWPGEPIMSLALTCDDCATLITVSGEIDMSNAHLLTEAVEFACHPPAPTIAVDLSAVTFFGAHGVSALLRAQHAAIRAEAVFRLRDPAPCVTYILAATGVLRLFDPDGTLRTVTPALDGGRRTTGGRRAPRSAPHAQRPHRPSRPTGGPRDVRRPRPPRRGPDSGTRLAETTPGPARKLADGR